MMDTLSTNESLDKLDQIFQHQRRFQESLKVTFDIDYLRVMTLALIVETAEMIQEAPWKPWKKNQEYHNDKLKEELADMLHFFINLCLASGMDSNTLFNQFMRKNQINFDRQKSDY